MYESKEIKLPFPPPPFWKLLGIEVVEMDEGYAKLIMPFQEKITQPYGLVHGGALSTLADSAAAIAVVKMVEPGTRFVTVEMKINYLAPVKGGVTEAEAKVLRRGKRIIPIEVDVTNNDMLVAKAISTYIILEENKKL
jgi:acyl-CoA thioesterase